MWMVERIFMKLKDDKRFHLYPRYTIYFHDRRNDLKSITFTPVSTIDNSLSFVESYLWEHDIAFTMDNFVDLYKSKETNVLPELTAKLIGEVSLEGTEEEVWERLQDIFWSGSI